MDLTQSYPRSAREKIAGVVMIARTSDKGKAEAYGNPGDYHYDCPMDKAVFGFLGIEAGAFLDVIKHAKSDADIESYVSEHAAKKTPEEIATWNAGFLLYGPEPGSESAAYFEELRGAVAPERTDITAWADLLDLDEKRDVPKRIAATV